MSERVPLGIEHGKGLSLVPSLRVTGVGDFANGRKQHKQSTFDVKPKHETLPSGGVRFNVETLEAAEEEHLKKPIIDRKELLTRIQDEAKNVYKKKDDEYCGRDVYSPPIRLEAVSDCPENMVFVGGQGFYAACLAAFAQHLPLEISPDHVWSLISFAFAQHVDKHAEELRANFVEHEGKKRLLVVADHMVMGGDGDPDSGSSPQVWEATIFSSFSNQIKEHIGEYVHSAIARDFSTTTATSRAVHEITLMSAMKSYFSYGMSTACGIPNITLLGSEEDWVALRARAEALGKLMTPELSSSWMPALLPVLDEFVLSYKGQVNHGFWQSMVKLRYRGGSGACAKITGWLQIFYPYLRGGRLNRDLRPWQQMYFSGPDPDDIPAVLSSAPVDWDYYGTTYDLHFSAGFTGCKQDPTDGTLTPVSGWFVTHDPPSDPKERIKKINDEVEALLKGHAEEAKADVIETRAPWFVRVSQLCFEQKTIYESLTKKMLMDEERITRERERKYPPWVKADRKRRLEYDIKEHEANKRALESAPKFGSPESVVRAFFAKK